LPAVSTIVAPQGSALAVAVVSCANLESSLQFYRDVVGLDPGSVVAWHGTEIEQLWQLRSGAGARACLLAAGSSPVGRVLLLEFEGAGRELIQQVPDSQVFGLANLNFYIRDARAVARDLAERGYVFWTDPTRHSLTAGVGNPIEVIFDGPDGVAINLVELASDDPATRIGQMRAYVERQGYTRTGFTAVVTTSHVCRSIRRAREFYEQVLHMGALIDEELSAPHVNDFLRLPRDARTHITFMQGNHMFGKIALGEPLNYADQCVDLVPRAHAPNIGYLAQGFEVRDIGAAWSAAAASGAQVVVGRMRAPVPGLGPCHQFVVRNPGSGALQWIFAGGGLEDS
jgi:catechol 2,3-dioxygenase-like lactoylglutathione lyase family enzyme